MKCTKISILEEVEVLLGSQEIERRRGRCKDDNEGILIIGCGSKRMWYVKLINNLTILVYVAC